MFFPIRANTANKEKRTEIIAEEECYRKLEQPI